MRSLRLQQVNVRHLTSKVRKTDQANDLKRLIAAGDVDAVADALERDEKNNVISASAQKNLRTYSLYKTYDEEGFQSVVKYLKRAPFSSQERLELCNDVLNNIVRRSEKYYATTLMTFMNEEGIEPDVTTYNLLIELHLRDGDRNLAREVYGDMLARGTALNERTIALLLKCSTRENARAVRAFYHNVCGKTNVHLAASRELSEIYLQTLASCKTYFYKTTVAEFQRISSPTSDHYNSLLRAIVRQKRIKSAHRLIATMYARGRKPTREQLLTFFSYYKREGFMVKFADFVEEFEPEVDYDFLDIVKVAFQRETDPEGMKRIYKYVSGSEATENYDEILKIHLANAISKEEEAATKRVQGSPNTDAATKDNENAVPASQNICNQLATSGGGGADAQNGRSSGPNVESSSEEDKER